MLEIPLHNGYLIDLAARPRESSAKLLSDLREHAPDDPSFQAVFGEAKGGSRFLGFLVPVGRLATVFGFSADGYDELQSKIQTAHKAALDTGSRSVRWQWQFREDDEAKAFEDWMHCYTASTWRIAGHA